MKTSAPNFFVLQYRPTPPLLRGQVLRPLDVAEFTEAGELMLLEARRRGCPYWLVDGRADQLRQQPALHYWLEEDYFPRVRTALGRPPVVAFLTTPCLWAQLQQQGVGGVAPTPLLAADFRTGWFTEEAPAQAWLDRFRATTTDAGADAGPAAYPAAAA